MTDMRERLIKVAEQAARDNDDFAYVIDAILAELRNPDETVLKTLIQALQMTRQDREYLREWMPAAWTAAINHIASTGAERVIEDHNDVGGANSKGEG